MTIDRNRFEVPHRRRSQQMWQRGFTLIELIMVMVMLGILSIYAAPRMFNSGDFYARGFHDETLALLRYAQKTAIAQRRTVCVAFVSSAPASATLSIASAPATSTCNTALIGPNQSCPVTGIGSTGCITAKSGISYSTSPASLNFNGLGQPVAYNSSGTALSSIPLIQVLSAAKAVTVEAETGYVHD